MAAQPMLTEIRFRAGAGNAVQTGRGPDLVILHSLLADRAAFDKVLPALATRYRVTLFNLPGFHGSAPVAATPAAYTDWIRDGFDAAAIGPTAILLGNGFGGTLALAFAIAHPDRIGRLIVSDAGATFPEAGKQAFRVMAEKVAADGLGAVAEIAANRVYHAAYLAANPDAVEERRQALLRIHPEAFQAACRLLVDADLLAGARTVTVPTAVVCGALDQATPPPLNRAIADAIPGATYREIPDCGHCPPLEMPEKFLAVTGL